MSCLATMRSNVLVEGDIDINKQPLPVHGRKRSWIPNQKLRQLRDRLCDELQKKVKQAFTKS